MALLIPLQVLSFWVNANAIFVSFRRKTTTIKYTMLSPVNGVYHQHAPWFSWVLISPWRSFSLFLLYRAKAEAKRLQCALSTEESGRWVNSIDLGMWDWAKINSAEGMIKLTLRYVLHHQLFGFWRQILPWASVRHLGFSGYVVLELQSSEYSTVSYRYSNL